MNYERGDRVTLSSTSLPRDLYGLAGTVLRVEGLTLHVKLDDPPFWYRDMVTFEVHQENVVKGVYHVVQVQRDSEVDVDRSDTAPDAGVPRARKLQRNLRKR